MRELDRHSLPTSAYASSPLRAATIIGRGRMGYALSAALRSAGIDVSGPLPRGAVPTGARVVVLCVPDGEIAAAAALVPDGAAVGHCSGASGLDALAGHREAFSMHPLMTVTSRPAGVRFAGAAAAVDGRTPASLHLARSLAGTLGMRPIEIAPSDRAAYHAAASIASNFLVTIEAAAERLAATAGLAREDLVPLVRATVENWAALGADGALTGPVVRGDDATVVRQREAVAGRTPELTPLFDALVSATRELARAGAAVA
jgi:predicted short-subunit dehydrogenase-like oxidoreductase (DUF2520 family)